MEKFDKYIILVKEWAIDFAPNFFAGLAIFFLGWMLAKTAKSILLKICDKKQWDRTLAEFVADLSYACLMIFIVISALGQMGVNTNSFVAVIGAAGLAVGFALQGSLSNFASGIMIVVFRPYKIGDFVEAAGVMGVVDKIQIFSTLLKTPDNKSIIVPNASMTGGNITNYSAEPTRRLDLIMGIGYEDDIDQARQVISDTVKANHRILAEPPIQIAVTELADSSVNFVVRPWVKTEDYWDAHFELTEAIKKALDASNISIPYPQRDVHLHQVSS